MPRFRNLGINVIPVTMRPPEIGAGGGGGGGGGDVGDGWTACGSGDTCVGGDAVRKEWTSCSGDTCVPPAGEAWTGNCSGDTCVADEWTGGCASADTCGPKPLKKDARGFSQQAIAELKQQLEDRIDP